LTAPGLLFAQEAAALVGQSAGLKIVVIEGEAAQNNVRTRTATAPVVEVRDENDKPVSGAEVVFQLPAAGPGGSFHGWMRNQTVRTNAEGRAAATGLTPNDELGRFNIKVTATAGTRTATGVIAQSNVSGGGMGSGSSRKWWVIGALGAGALAGGIYAATSNGDSGTNGPPGNPVTITPGAVTVAGPR
jgi:hypothetical protein